MANGYAPVPQQGPRVISGPDRGKLADRNRAKSWVADPVAGGDYYFLLHAYLIRSKVP
ncbi:MAG: hypothetical protein ACE5GH_06275 [Fidelibacterota bacterium]